jgi:subfamily B ATP-binding cassette protein MsbA
VWQNIAYGKPEASRDEIVRAVDIANASEFIDRLPEGYDTVLGERGMTLSGGQRQRLAIARAVIRNAPILILDEPTTGLDSESEQLVLEALDRLMQGKTSIVIAHRLSTIQRANVIFVVNEGRIAEQGTHQELLRRGGLYAELHDVQFNKQEIYRAG